MSLQSVFRFVVTSLSCMLVQHVSGCHSSETFTVPAPRSVKRVFSATQIQRGRPHSRTSLSLDAASVLPYALTLATNAMRQTTCTSTVFLTFVGLTLPSKIPDSAHSDSLVRFEMARRLLMLQAHNPSFCRGCNSLSLIYLGMYSCMHSYRSLAA